MNPTRTFTGKELDSSGLYYFGARYYHPELARFTSIDPVSLNLTRPGLEDLAQGRNLQQVLTDPRLLHPYAYAANNPTKYIDENGAIFDTILDVGFIAYDLGRIGYQYASQGQVKKGEWTALGADAVGALIPGATGLGIVARVANHADDAAKVAKVAVKAGEEITERGGFQLGRSTFNHVINGDARGGAHMFEQALNNGKLANNVKTDLISRISYGIKTVGKGIEQLKTYFPSNWNASMVEEAASKLSTSGQVVGLGRGIRYIEANLYGITVRGHVNSRNIITTFYPVARHLRNLP